MHLGSSYWHGQDEHQRVDEHGVQQAAGHWCGVKTMHLGPCPQKLTYWACHADPQSMLRGHLEQEAGGACRSIWGFQSLSKKMTVSADCRFRPCPPARVDSRNMKIWLWGALKAASWRTLHRTAAR